MVCKQALLEIFNNPFVKKLPAPSLVASVVAAMVHPVLAGIGFEAAGAAAALAKIGFQVAGELLPSLLEVARKGMSALGDWLEKEIAGKPEINEAAAHTMVEQAEAVAETVAETHPDDKAEIADAIGEGLTASGGATAEIAEQYKAAIKEAAELRKLVEEMRTRLDAWASQSVEARRGSLIENVEQRMKGRGRKQEIRAEDDSSISGVKQIIE